MFLNYQKRRFTQFHALLDWMTERPGDAEASHHLAATPPKSLRRDTPFAIHAHRMR
ncbi:hypothetical protein C7S16_5768 [Burkholderia thailandensis]|uniref:Uncharacterized protein n=1 Tax=Burkholderia thailandensis TaxID=57975 RepID=A0AAW9CIS3_BURTH|nr:hypothetical protein [Burkholderia thailandensis]MDW9250658.1 hypothetical protein [Burkholderia thailandensis]